MHLPGAKTPKLVHPAICSLYKPIQRLRKACTHRVHRFQIPYTLKLKCAHIDMGPLISNTCLLYFFCHSRIEINEYFSKFQAALHSKTCRCKTVVTREISTQTDVLAKETSNQSQSTQTVYDKYTLGAKVETIMLKNQMKTNVPQTEKSKESDKPLLNLDSIKSNDKKMRFFTGLTFIQFMALFTFLGDSVNNLIYWDSKKDKKLSSSEKTAGKSNRKTEPIQEMFICLLRLRRGYNLFAISHFCNLSQTTVRTIFTTWLQLLFCHFDGIRHLMFPDRSTLKKFAPSSFKAFKNVRCSIDCTEFFVEMPRDFAQQGNLYSNYKHHHTYKCLIAVAPNGAATFVSDLYEGSISDKDIFARCGILDYINPGDLVLADRGFTVTDLLNEKQAHLNIPAFLKGRTKLTPKEELLTRKIARARIHVERFNERLKKFRLISGRIPLNISHIANQAVFVASCLVNFQAPLAK